MSSVKFGGRTLARSQALQLLFQAEIAGRTVSEVLSGPYALGQWPLDEYGEELALGADEMRHDLDAVISCASTNWSIARMPMVDRNLLRLALYEMLVQDEVAIAVTIDESVELAKAFGTDESSRFVNGLLGRVASDLEAGVDVVEAAHAKMAREEEDVPAVADEGVPADADEVTTTSEDGDLPADADAPTDVDGEA